MKTLQRWIAVFIVAVAALAGSFLFNLTLHRDVMARDGSPGQSTAKWQMTAVPTANNSYEVFLVNQETGEVYRHGENTNGFKMIGGPFK